LGAGITRVLPYFGRWALNSGGGWDMAGKSRVRENQTQTEPPTGGVNETRRAQGARGEVVATTADGRIALVKTVKNGREFYSVRVKPYPVPRYGSNERVREVLEKNFELQVKAHVFAREKAKELGVWVDVVEFVGRNGRIRVAYVPQTGRRLVTMVNIPDDVRKELDRVLEEADKRSHAGVEQ